MRTKKEIIEEIEKQISHDRIDTIYHIHYHAEAEIEKMQRNIKECQTKIDKFDEKIRLEDIVIEMYTFDPFLDEIEKLNMRKKEKEMTIAYIKSIQPILQKISQSCLKNALRRKNECIRIIEIEKDKIKNFEKRILVNQVYIDAIEETYDIKLIKKQLNEK